MFGLMLFAPSAPVSGTVGAINSAIGMVQAVLGLPITNAWDAATLAAAKKVVGAGTDGSLSPAAQLSLGLNDDATMPYGLSVELNGPNAAAALVAYNKITQASGGNYALTPNAGADAGTEISPANAAAHSATIQAAFQNSVALPSTAAKAASKGGMSKTEEDALIVGGIVVVGAIITFVVMKRRGKFGKKHGKSRR